MDRGLTVVVAAYNEEANIKDAIESLREGFRGYTDDYEILIVNDGSADHTGAIAEAEAAKDKRIRVVHNKENKGQAYSLHRGYQLACKEYVTVFPGDNDLSSHYLRDFLREMGQADILITYMTNIQDRSIVRRTLSRTFVHLLNLLFGLQLRNYNGAPLYRTKVIQTLNVTSSRGMTLLAECLVRLLSAGATYKEIPSDFVGRKGGRSRAVSFRNFVECFLVLRTLIRDVYILKQPRGIKLAATSTKM